MPIPELIKQSYPQAGRIIISDLIHEVNDYIKKKFHVHTLIRGQKVPHVYLDQKKLKKMSKQKRQLVMQAVYKKLSEYPGISAVYDAQKLLEKQVPVGSMEGLFKNNIYQGRSGDLFLLIAPYTMVSKYPKGTKHYTPYAYNRHVPLILYQPGTIERKIITQQVAPNQVVATLAKLYRIARPDYMLEPLPGI
jgi:hypothetical protein